MRREDGRSDRDAEQDAQTTSKDSLPEGELSESEDGSVSTTDPV